MKLACPRPLAQRLGIFWLVTSSWSAPTCSRSACLASARPQRRLCHRSRFSSRPVTPYSSRPAYRLVQESTRSEAPTSSSARSAATRSWLLTSAIVDDIGYVQQNADEDRGPLSLPLPRGMKHRSVLLRRSRVRGESRIGSSKTRMTTAAAIDRLVHHSVILEFAV